MWVSSIELSNIKSFEDSGVINLDKRMNILIGPNNAGKSVIIKALYLLQDIQALSVEDIRRGESEGKIVIGLEEIDVVQYQQIYHATEGFLSKVHITISSSSNKPNKDMLVINQDGASVGTDVLSQSEPNNYIYPFLAKRTVMNYDTSVNLSSQMLVPENLSLLTAKISRIADQHYELNKIYEAACKDIIGFSLSTVAIPTGQIVGLPIGKYRSIPITAMGEGIPHLLGLINDLCLAENKLFLIESRKMTSIQRH
jgi:predicted ATP-dependent endonuclease of OLD family